MVLRSVRVSFVFLGLFTLLLGGLYPAVCTGVLQGLFPFQANGSLIKDRDGKVLGSALIGQDFSAPQYFWGRLSATSPGPYNAAASTGSNYGVNNPDLLKAAQARIKALREADPTNPWPIPVDLVTASGSGLDPHISIAAANYQAQRVATARHLGVEKVRRMVTQFTTPRLLGFFGEPVVNVLRLNLALDRRATDGF